MKTVVGLFDTMEHAKKASLDIENAGITRDDISLVANNASGQYAPNEDVTPSEVTGHAIGRDATVGAEIGGVAGLLIGLTGLAIPGLGWVAGAGWFWGMISGAMVGAVTGGLVGALTHVGVSPEDASYYNEGLRRGGTLVVIRAQDTMADRVAEILGDDGAANIEERAEQYRSEGFTPMGTVAGTTATTMPMPTPFQPVAPMTAGTTSYPTTTTGNTEHVGRGMGYEEYSSAFRNDYQAHYADRGWAYERYETAYRYGFDSANDPRYRGRDWNAVQSDLQRDWESRQPGTWDRVSNSVRFAWDKATGAERGGIQTGGYALDGTQDTRGITEKMADTLTGDRIDDKTGNVVR